VRADLPRTEAHGGYRHHAHHRQPRRNGQQSVHRSAPPRVDDHDRSRRAPL